MINKDLASPSLFRFHVHRLVALCFVDPEVMMFRRSAQTWSRGRSWCFTENPATCRSWTPKNHARNPIGSFFFPASILKIGAKSPNCEVPEVHFLEAFSAQVRSIWMLVSSCFIPTFVLSCSNSKRCRKTSPLCCITLTYFNHPRGNFHSRTGDL